MKYTATIQLTFDVDPDDFPDGLTTLPHRIAAVIDPDSHLNISTITIIHVGPLPPGPLPPSSPPQAKEPFNAPR